MLSVLHEPSSSVAVCGALSPFVQPMTSPTLAVTGSGVIGEVLDLDRDGGRRAGVGRRAGACRRRHRPRTRPGRPNRRSSGRWSRALLQAATAKAATTTNGRRARRRMAGGSSSERCDQSGIRSAGQPYAGLVAIGSRAIVRDVMEAPGTGRPAAARRRHEPLAGLARGALARAARPRGPRRSATPSCSTTRTIASRSGTASPASPGRTTPTRSTGGCSRSSPCSPRSTGRPHVWPLPGFDEPADLRRPAPRRRLRGRRRRV